MLTSYSKHIKISVRTGLLAILVALCVGFSNTHEYYVSVTKVEYVKEQQSLQVISQIFIDDFEKLIQQRYDDSIALDILDESDMVDKYMEKYLKAKLHIKINTGNTDFKFLGKEYKDDIVYCYIEIENVSEIKTIEITNEVLFDLYLEQQNIVRTKINGKDKSFILVFDNRSAVLNFD